MAHIIEVVRNTEAEARSFLDALFYSDSVSAIGHRQDDSGKIRAIAVNWDDESESELDERISQMITDVIEASEDIDELTAYRRIFPETVPYQPKCTDIE